MPLETEVLLQDNYKRNRDLSHLEDLALKSAIDYFGDELIHWLGIQEKAVRSAPTEIVELETRHMYEDFLYEMENGIWYHFEFESDSLTVDDLRRFREYEASTARRINAPVITYVICSSKVRQLRSSISEGINTYRVRVIRLKDNDSGKILSQLEQKMTVGLQREDIIPLLLSPLMAEKQEQKNFEILKYDGIRARNMNQLDYAIRCFEQAIALREDPETLHYLSDAYIKTQRLDEARIILDKLIKAAPDDVSALITLAHTCYMQEDYGNMDLACQQAISLDEKNASAHYLAAKAAQGMGNALQAIARATQAIALDESFAAAYRFRAETLWEMKQAKEALEDIGKVLSINPDDEDALLLKGTVLAAQGQAEEAGQCADKVLEENPFNEKAYVLKGRLLAGKKAFDEAIGLYTEALELMPENAALYQERGRVRYLNEDKEGAIDDMTKALELNPDAEVEINGKFDNF